MGIESVYGRLLSVPPSGHMFGWPSTGAVPLLPSSLRNCYFRIPPLPWKSEVIVNLTVCYSLYFSIFIYFFFVEVMYVHHTFLLCYSFCVCLFKIIFVYLGGVGEGEGDSQADSRRECEAQRGLDLSSLAWWSELKPRGGHYPTKPSRCPSSVNSFNSCLLSYFLYSCLLTFQFSTLCSGV